MKKMSLANAASTVLPASSFAKDISNCRVRLHRLAVKSDEGQRQR